MRQCDTGAMHGRPAQQKQTTTPRQSPAKGWRGVVVLHAKEAQSVKLGYERCLIHARLIVFVAECPKHFEFT